MNVGLIGTGIMGSRMAHNLYHAGHAVTVYNRTKAKADDLIKAGVAWAQSPAALAHEADVVITMLAHPEAVEEMAQAEGGFLNVLDAGKIWIDSSTVHPSFSRRMAAQAAEHDVQFLGAPVAGSKGAAANAELVFIVGGASATVEKVRPLLDAMGSRVMHLDEDPGMGSAFKLVVNHLLATTMAAFSEGLVLGEALGVPQETLLNAILGGPLAAPYLNSKREKIETNDFTDTEFPLRWMQKDLHMAALAAYEVEQSLPLGNAAKEAYQLAKQHGFGSMDFSAIYAFLKYSE